jgi:Hypothetical protein (DUF2513)
MKRDMDLVRKILFVMEDDDWYLSFGEGHLPQVEGYSEEQIQYHMQIMAQAGLLHLESYEIDAGAPGQTIKMKSYSLSWDGHEFLAAARNDTFWNRAKAEMAKAIGDTGRFMLPVLTELLTSYLKAGLRLP